MVSRVLITGANGFIGRHCVTRLSTNVGYEVHAVGRSERASGPGGVVYHSVDLLDRGQVDRLVEEVKASHLLHLAWYTEHGKFWTSPLNLKWVEASSHLLQAFVTHGGRRCVAAGTCAEYDWRYGYCSEAVTPLAPGTLYGACKHAFQGMLEAFSASNGMRSAWGRIFLLFGPHEHPDRLVPSVITAALQGREALCSHGTQVRDFLCVEDVADAFVRLLESDVSGPVNIASGRAVAIRDLVTRIAERLDATDRLRFGALPSRPGDPPLLVGDTTRLTQEVGWTPRYDLDAAVDRTIEWWRQNASGAAVAPRRS
jgi:nucleoside-diphosphate-sugar epimerase